MSTKQYINATDAIHDIKGHLFFGQMVKSLRMCADISQVEAAKRLGISKQYLCNIESGERKADIPLAIKLAELLDHPQDFLISRLLEDQLYMAGLDYSIQLNAS